LLFIAAVSHIHQRFLKGFVANEQAEDSAKGCIYHFGEGGKGADSRLPHHYSWITENAACQ